MSEDIFESLRNNPEAMQAMFQSKGWEIWVEWIGHAIKKHQEVALKGAPSETVLGDIVQIREEARMMALALEKVQNIPFYLAEVVKASADEAPEIPQATS